MPRAAGEAEKLGNRYEGVWTTDTLLDLLDGEAVSVTVESFNIDDARGVEFVKQLRDGTREFHSVKRQKSGNVWSLYDLSEERNGPSVLETLATKLRANPGARVVFVSGTTPNELSELCDRASRSRTSEAFAEHLNTAQDLKKGFEGRVLPLFAGDFKAAYAALQRWGIDGGPERALIRRVEHRIRRALRRHDGGEFEPISVRLLLSELVLDWLGQPITRDEVLNWLRQNHFTEREWARDVDAQEGVERRVSSYLMHVEAELVQPMVARSEVQDVVDALQRFGPRRVALLGPAGLGKSCVVAGAIRLLKAAGVPCLPVRLDVQSYALTARQLGQALDLPESPALVLGGIARGRDCVLVLDQLDALSFTSGRNQQLWEAFEELLWEAAEYPNMRVLLACRAFDAEHDPRLRRLLADEQQATQVKLKILEPGDVKSVLAANNVDATRLGSSALELLRLPLNLSLFLQADPTTEPGFSTEQDLLERYWQHKMRQAGSTIRWFEVIERLSDWLSKKQTLSAPAHVLRELEPDANRLAALHVLAREGNQFRFFHEAFFDFCWARIFAEREQPLAEFLLQAEQHLFRRAQVRQILSYRRGVSYEDYLRDLADIVANPAIRFHLKKLTLDWLRALPNPREPEWLVVESFYTRDDAPRMLGGDVLWRSVPWFDLLLRLGVWERWLDSADQSTMNRAIWLLSMSEVMRARSAQIAGLFAPYVAGKKRWRSEYLGIFRFGEAHHRREMFDLLLWAVRESKYEEWLNQHFVSFHEIPKSKPELAAEFLGVVIDALLRRSGESTAQTYGIRPDFVVTTSRAAPAAFLREVVPRLRAELSGKNRDDPSSVFGSPSWHMMREKHLYDFQSALRAATEEAMEALAKQEPATFSAVSAELMELRHDTAERLLLNAWAQNGAAYGERCAQYLLEDDERLQLGYLTWGSGNGHAAVSRNAISAAAPYCSMETYARLEGRIAGLAPTYERKTPKARGYVSMLLLACLPPQRMSLPAKRRLVELKRKFPSERFAGPQPVEASFVPPPIPRKATQRMTDKNWMSAVARYTSDGSESFESYRRGGIFRLTPELRRAAQIEKPRFAELALKMSDTVPAPYFASILSGITCEEQQTGEEDKVPAIGLQPLATGLIAEVIERLHRLPGKPCGKDICWAIRAISEREPPLSLLPIVSYYATLDPDPGEEKWVRSIDGEKASEGDPHFYGLNSTRGAAAEAIAALLFDDKSRYGALEPAIQSLVADPSVSVRSCTVAVLVAMLNFDRTSAVRLFLELCDGADSVLKTSYVDQFLHHASYDHYSVLRPLMLHMLKLDKDQKAQATAACQITVAAFHEPLAAEDLEIVFAGGATCRKASADVYAHNLTSDRIAEACRNSLPRFFDDEDPDVRAAAAGCFRDLSDDRLTQEEPLMYQFIASRACPEHSEDLVIPLENSVRVLPEVICRLPERLIAEHRSSNASEHIERRHWIYHLPALITRLYDQSTDAGRKTRCLDIIDDMLRLGFSEIDEELEKVER